jgi:hypothetical protein
MILKKLSPAAMIHIKKAHRFRKTSKYALEVALDVS